MRNATGAETMTDLTKMTDYERELVQNLVKAHKGGSSLRFVLIQADGHLRPELDKHGRHNTMFTHTERSAEYHARINGGLSILDLAIL